MKLIFLLFFVKTIFATGNFPFPQAQNNPYFGIGSEYSLDHFVIRFGYNTRTTGIGGLSTGVGFVRC